jgi:hypothetical protein
MASQADRAALAEVLSSPEFQAQRWRGEALRRWLEGWWERLTALLGTSEAERWAGLGRAVFLAAALVAALLLWRAWRRGRTGSPLRPGPAGPGLAAAPAGGVTLADAERALAAGDASGTVRLAFRAAVAVVGRPLGAGAGVLTGGELAGRLADQGFSRLALLHDRTVFGRRPVSGPEAEAALAVAVRLVAGPAGGPDPGRPGVAP